MFESKTSVIITGVFSTNFPVQFHMDAVAEVPAGIVDLLGLLVAPRQENLIQRAGAVGLPASE